MPGIGESLHYLFLGNPISSGVTSYAKSTAGLVCNYMGLSSAAAKSPTMGIMSQPEPLWKLAAATGPFVRLAALSGAAAVILGAYGSHKQYPTEKSYELKKAFDTASRYHFIHTLALLGLPLCRYQMIPGTLMVSGIVIFCGTCYYYAFTGDRRYNKLTPIGGTCLILSWLSMCL